MVGSGSPHAPIILTGLPRAGTTLTCTLLNEVGDTVALNEPIDFSRLSGRLESVAVCERVEAFSQATRASLARSGVATSKQVGGRVVSASFAFRAQPAGRKPLDRRADERLPRAVLFRDLLRRYLSVWRGAGRRAAEGPSLRPRVAFRGEVRFAKPLGEHLSLYIKHCAVFTGALEELDRRYDCFAIVRNPLAVLGSWNSIAGHVQRGHLPHGEALDPTLAEALASIPAAIDRQLVILEWHFARYLSILGPDRIVRYEDLVACPVTALSRLGAEHPGRGPRLRCHNRSLAYDKELMARIGDRLLRRGGAHRDLYSRTEIEELWQQAIGGPDTPGRPAG